MEIKGRVYCFFEQSGTFKNEFHKLGYEAEDYDIQNEFGQTDHVMDLFKEIENGFDGKESIFDKITKDDLVMAFFPCIYFCATSQMVFSFGCYNYRRKDDMEIAREILERSKNREKYYALLVKLFAICRSRELRLIVENPYSMQTYLKANFTPPYDGGQEQTSAWGLLQEADGILVRLMQSDLWAFDTDGQKAEAYNEGEACRTCRVMQYREKYDFKRLCEELHL